MPIENDELTSEELEELEELDEDDGIELDKIEIPEQSSQTLPVASVPKPPGSIEPEQKIAAKPSRKKLPPMRIITGGAIACTVVLVVMLLWWTIGQNESRLSVLKHQIDPIYTNLDDSRHVRISLIVRFSPQQGESAELIESISKDSILTFLAEPETRENIKAKSLQKVEIYINNEINRLLNKNLGNRVIIKELSVY